MKRGSRQPWPELLRQAAAGAKSLALRHAALGHAALVKPSFAFLGLIFVCSSRTTFYLWIPINYDKSAVTHTVPQTHFKTGIRFCVADFLFRRIHK
jgi:hypothetical protein